MWDHDCVHNSLLVVKPKDINIAMRVTMVVSDLNTAEYIAGKTQAFVPFVNQMVICSDLRPSTA